MSICSMLNDVMSLNLLIVRIASGSMLKDAIVTFIITNDLILLKLIFKKYDFFSHFNKCVH